MTLLLTILWPALVASLVLGGLVGAWAGWPAGRRALTTAAPLAAFAILLTALALFGPVAGRAGFWTEIVAICLDGYLVGCAIGGLLRQTAGKTA